MLRRSAIGALALTVAAVAALPAQAEPVHTPTLSKTSRFTRLDAAQLGKIVNQPQSQNQDKVVSALVQLSGDPVAVQREKGVRGFTRRSAERRVKAIQDTAMPKLKAAGATSYGRLDTVLNAVQVRVKVRDLAKVAAVRGVKTVQVSTQVKPDNAAAAKFTGVDRTWQDLRRTGRGQVIGIIDTGIDYTHAGFGGPGTAAAFTGNDGTVIEPGTFPTAKVTGGYDFVGDDYDAGSDVPADTVPRPDRDPLDCQGHGSHVAGTAAGGGVASNGTPYTGPYNVATLNRTFAVEPGAAPQATLKAYRVFGCEGSVNDDIIVAAIDRAVSDGVDVLNMSLGSPFGTADNLNDVAIRTATDSGTLVVVSAGNEGSSAYIVGQSSTSTDALSVAAVDAELKNYPGVSITGAVSTSGLNANEAAIASPITGELVDLGLGCAAPAYAAAAGKIALTTRGDCARADRATFGQQAGALAVVMINEAPGLPPYEGTIAGVTIPFIGIDGARRAEFIAANGESITIAASAGIVNPGYSLAADFSSNGPRRVDSAQKPDVAAPGVAVRSVDIGTGTGSTRKSGTSMAAPHTTGVAALVRQSRPTWTPRQVKAALMSTANPDKIGGYDSRRVGTGLVQPLRAAASKTYSYTTSRLNSLRFGMNQLTGAYAETQSFRIANRTKSTSVTYDLATKLSSNRYGADITISPRSVKLKAGETRNISVRIALSRADVARLPGAGANDDGELVSLNGLIVATPRKADVATPALRTSFLFVPVPLSHIRASASVAETSPGVFSAIKVTNKGVHAGTADLYAWLLADPAGDAFDSETADLTNIGVQSLPVDIGGAPASDRLMVFAASQAVWTSTQATREVDIVIDTNGDEEADFVTFAADTGLVLTGTSDGTMSAFTQDLTTGDLVDVWAPAPAPANGSTIELPVLASSLGLTAASPPITVAAAGFTTLYAAPGDEVNGTASFDPFQPVVSQGDFVSLNPGQTRSIPVQVDSTQLASQTSAGWLVVNLDDRAGISEADRVPLRVSRPNPALLNKTTR